MGDAQEFARSVFTSNTLTAGGNINVTFSSILGGGGSESDIEIIAPWLSNLNYKLFQSTTYSRVTEGTGKWIFNTKVFHDWVNKETTTIWGTGFPGAGKTFLSSIVIHQLKSRIENPGKIAVLFIYCRSDSQPPIIQLLGSLLRQLAEDHPSELAFIKQQFFNQHNKSDTTPTHTDYVEILKKVISRLSHVFIIIDGLDELEDRTRSLLLHDLGALGSSLFLMSRPLEDPGFYDLPNAVTFNVQADSDELRAFILGEIKGNRELRAALHNRVDVTNEVVQAVSEASQGLYLLASHQMDALMISEGIVTISAVRDMIARLPRNLDDMYGLTFERIEQQGPEKAVIARRALFWTMHALRPLTVGELCLAASISPGAGISSPDDIIDPQTLLGSCRGLIFCTKGSAVHLAHETIKAYLNDHHSSVFDGYSDNYLMSCCFTALTSLGLDHKRALYKDGIEASIRSWNLGYISRYWLRHAELSCADEENIPKEVDGFIRGFSSCIVTINDNTDNNKSWDIWKPIHVSVHLSLMSMTRDLQEHCNAKSGRGITPLHVAIHQQDKDMVSLLLGFESIDVNASGGYVDAPLMAACNEVGETTLRQTLQRHGITDEDNFWDFGKAILFGNLHGRDIRDSQICRFRVDSVGDSDIDYG